MKNNEYLIKYKIIDKSKPILDIGFSIECTEVVLSPTAKEAVAKLQEEKESAGGMFILKDIKTI